MNLCNHVNHPDDSQIKSNLRIEIYSEELYNLRSFPFGYLISKPTIIGIFVMKTLSAKPAEVQHDWYVVDASGKTLGRLSTEIARRLRGKHKTTYTPHVDTGDYIVVINAEQIQVTGNKAQDKKYYRHTGYPGGLRETNFEKLIAHKPTEIIERAVKGMLPKGPLGYAMIKKMKVYAGSEHPHTAQQPQVLDI